MDTSISSTPCSNWVTFNSVIYNRAPHCLRCDFHPKQAGNWKAPIPQVILWMLFIFAPKNVKWKLLFFCCRRFSWVSGRKLPGFPHQCQEEFRVPPGCRKGLFTHTPKPTVTGCRAAWQGSPAPHPHLPETNLPLGNFSPVVPGLIHLWSNLLVLICLLGLILPIKMMSLHSN